MDTEKMIEDLQDPGAYPETTGHVKLIQTHISWVFICDDHVYKIKKPVDFGFLDFTTLAKRKLYCEKEVELNKRMAHDVYLGVYPVVYSDGRYSISDKTADHDLDAVEYAVKMRVLPDESLMKNRFLRGALKEDDIARIAETVSRFHSTAARSSAIDKFGTLESVKFNTDENFAQTEQYIGTAISDELFRALRNWTAEFYQDHGEVFSARIGSGHVRDCHGDLHMEHVCLTDPIIIFDCIEFNDRFRYSDTASDLAFLLMDLDFHGGAEFANKLYDSYLECSGAAGSDLELVVKYYKVYRAYVRGKVNSFRLGDPSISEENKQKAVETARRYFELAYEYINE